MIRKLFFKLCVVLLAAGISNYQAEVAAQELNNVEKKYFVSRDFKLKNGQILPVLTIAYETYGKLAPSGRNAILITHGYTSSYHSAGRYSPSDPAPGTWDGLIVPGKAIDTNRYFVVASNNLGSSLIDRTGQHQSGDRQTVWPAFSAFLHPRHDRGSKVIA